MIRVRALDDMQLKFLNRRTWREVAADLQASVMLPNIVEALREGARRLHAPEVPPDTVEALAL